MSLSQERCTQVIAEHSAAFADVADGNLDADLEFCPGWTVRDVVHHLTQVHWFWATIVEDHLTERPDHLEAPEPAGDDVTIATFRSGADRLARVLGAAGPADRVWTWAPQQQNAAFVIRHQVQEVIGHHWDVAHAAGQGVEIAPDAGADSVDEFLHFSVSNPVDFPQTLPPALDGRFGLCCTDSDAAWVVSDGGRPGTAVAEPSTPAQLEAAGIPAVTGTGGQLLLWLYDRHAAPAGDADPSAVDAAVLKRFRGLCFTD